MSVNGKAKGSEYERKIAKLLAKWSGMELRRTPLSGGWARQNPRASGDIVCITGDDFPLHVECKDQESYSWETALHGKGPLVDWWDQTIRTCPEGKIPVLVFSRAYYDDWVMIRKEDVPAYFLMNDEVFSTVIYLKNRYIILLKEVLENFKVKDFVRDNARTTDPIR